MVASLQYAFYLVQTNCPSARVDMFYSFDDTIQCSYSNNHQQGKSSLTEGRTETGSQ